MGSERRQAFLLVRNYRYMKKLYVGNLPWTATLEDVQALFSGIGETLSVNLISDRDTGRSRGFGFVEMSASDADEAIAQLNGKDFQGRALTVNMAKERAPRPAAW